MKMSDREESPEPQENGSHASEKSHSPSPRASRTPSPEAERKASRSPHSRSRSHSRSHSYSRTYSRRHGSYSRSRSRSHSRRHRHHRYSRSHSRSPMYRRYSRSRSRSYSPRRSYSPKYYSPRHSPYHGKKNYGYNDNRSYYRSRSRSPMSNRRRHLGNRDDPSPSRCLGVFGLSLYTQERELKEVFSEYGHVKEVQVVYDAQSGRSRGFAFVYFETEDDAKAAKERCNGIEIDGRKIRVDYSITHRAHTPTPGIYMGKPTYPRGGGYRSGGSSYRGGRSPSPYRRYSRSRSRSYSPRIEDRSED